MAVWHDSFVRDVDGGLLVLLSADEQWAMGEDFVVAHSYECRVSSLRE